MSKKNRKKPPADRVRISENKPAGTNPVATVPQNLVRVAALICAILAFLLYANTLGHDYTVDDGTVISNNKITKKGAEAIPEIFSSAYRAGFWDRNEGLYRPLSVAMFALEWEIAPDNPALGHWINVILFSLSAAILLITLSRIFHGYSIAFPLLVSLLFVTHPVHTEVVSNIKSRDEILCFLFSMLTLLWASRFSVTKKIKYLLFGTSAYFLAFLSKESAITLLAVIPMVFWYTGKFDLRKTALYTLPFAGSMMAYMLIRYMVLGELKGSPLLQLVNNSLLGADSLLVQFTSAIYIMGKYLYLMIIPHPLSFDYSYNQIPLAGPGNPYVWITLMVLAWMAWVIIKGIGKRDPAAFGFLFFFATISLVSNVLFLIESTMAERFIYMPSLGLLIAAGYYVLRYFRLLHYQPVNGLKDLLTVKPALTTILVVILCLYSFKTISRNADWKDNLTLLEKDVKTSPNSARIRYAYGSALLIEKALKEEDKNKKNAILQQSINQLEKGVAILPNYAEAWNHLGVAYKELENYPAAVNAFEKARSYKDFKEADFYISAGLAYGNAKMYDKAIADFTRAISMEPGNAEAYNNKGLYLFETGDRDSSLVFFDKAIELKPEFYQAYYNKGNTLAAAGQYNRAIEMYLESLKHKPGYIDALLNMGNCYAALKEFNRAIELFAEVEKKEPHNRKMLINMGITYRLLGDEQKAGSYFERANKMGG
jgi:protein O-mannosyl-transferase